PKGWPEPSRPEKKSFEELAAIYAVREDSNWPLARAYLIEQRKRVGAPQRALRHFENELLGSQ
ncbi:MAG: hypothetical protein WBW78_09660, partial [Terrimicrobiaceae bacterium]